jgi:hypothetical protein
MKTLKWLLIGVLGFLMYQQFSGGSNGVLEGVNLPVNYDLSLKDAIAAGNYQSVDGISEDRFPNKRKGNKTEYVELWQANFDAERDDVLNFFESRGLRGAGLRELLALGAAYQDFQRDYKVIALGSAWSDGGKTNNPYLGGSQRSRWVKVFDEHLLPKGMIFVSVRGRDSSSLDVLEIPFCTDSRAHSMLFCRIPLQK